MSTVKLELMIIVRHLYPLIGCATEIYSFSVEQ